MRDRITHAAGHQSCERKGGPFRGWTEPLRHVHKQFRGAAPGKAAGPAFRLEVARGGLLTGRHLALHSEDHPGFSETFSAMTLAGIPAACGSAAAANVFKSFRARFGEPPPRLRRRIGMQG